MKAILILFLSVFFLFACDSGSHKSDSGTVKIVAPDTSSHKPLTLQPYGSPVVNDVLASYMQIKNALADDNSDAAASAAKAFIDVLEKRDTSMTPDKKRIFEETADDANEMAEHIGKSAGRIEHQREHFEMLTDDMYTLVKAFKPGKPLYKFFCAKYDDGVYWLSETKDIKNPYLGKNKAACAEVKEEIR